jgi:hypothetical protein
MNKASDEQLGVENEPHGWNKLTLTLNVLNVYFLVTTLDNGF